MMILLDIDGVVASWTDAVDALVQEHCGHPLDRTKWFKASDLEMPGRAKVMRAIDAPGFCGTFRLLPGAREFIKEMRGKGHTVHFLTSLWDSPTWVSDRNAWLRRGGLCPAPKGVTYSADKHMTFGDIFVDDKPDNVVKWQAEWPHSKAFLWTQPWNVDVQSWTTARASAWSDIADYVKGAR